MTDAKDGGHEPFPEIAFDGKNPDLTAVHPKVIAAKTAEFTARCFECAGYSTLPVEFLPEPESDIPYWTFQFDLQQLLDARGERADCEGVGIGDDNPPQLMHKAMLKR